MTVYAPLKDHENYSRIAADDVLGWIARNEPKHETADIWHPVVNPVPSLIPANRKYTPETESPYGRAVNHGRSYYAPLYNYGA